MNQSNKREYVDLYLDWFLNKSIELFFEPFKTGFYKVCEKFLIKEVIKYLICLVN